MKIFLKRLGLALVALFASAITVTAVEYFGGQPMGLFAGSRPANLGYNAGKFALPTWKPNCVSSTVDKSDDKHFIAPIAFTGSSTDAWEKLVGVVKSHARVKVVNKNANYLYAEFKSAGIA